MWPSIATTSTKLRRHTTREIDNQEMQQLSSVGYYSCFACCKYSHLLQTKVWYKEWETQIAISQGCLRHFRSQSVQESKL